jgi:hypothetical protein
VHVEVSVRTRGRAEETGLSDIAGVTQPASTSNPQGTTLVLDAGFNAE